mmetsp:Transcript_38700/g.105104  ORF Transcript_38700/g.105104 Transcript_38700/m.105104 type:complete len:90 (-) Transcript_38700:15-284(-)
MRGVVRLTAVLAVLVGQSCQGHTLKHKQHELRMWLPHHRGGWGGRNNNDDRDDDSNGDSRWPLLAPPRLLRLPPRQRRASQHIFPFLPP